jgi:hypothetical protein
MKIRQSAATVYKNKSTAAEPHYVDSCPADSGEISPTYRGFRVTCLAAELPTRQKAIDRFWSDQYFAAQTPAARQAVVEQEKSWRDAPREWT